MRAPIRYGRRSGGRDDTYTMVFSTLTGRPDYGDGTALVVPCRRPVRSVDDLVEEARHLWAAECPDREPGRLLSASWGAVGAMFSRAVDSGLRSGWAARVAGEPYPRLDSLRSEAAPIAADGTLAGRWPRTPDGDELRGFDVLLATPTRARLDHGGRRRYPTPREIASAWLHRRDGEERYFFRNVQSGIRTFQDPAIWRFLAASEKAAAFQERYPDAVALLEREASRPEHPSVARR